MAPPRLSKLELQIMEALWSSGAPLSVREIQEQFPRKGRPAYTTIQTTIGRLETKKAVAKVRKIGNAHIYQAAVSRNAAQRRLVDDLLAYKRLDGADAALATLARTLLDGDRQRIDSAATLRALGGAVPVTVVWGSADRIFPPGQASSVAAAEQSAAVRVIDDAGHMPHMERPAEAQAAVEETIARAR